VPVAPVNRTRLAAIAPNPTGGRTLICFELRERCDARIRVCDVSGRAVKTVHDGMTNPGRHELDWDAGGIAPGLYFLVFDAFSTHETRKVTVVR